MFGIDLYLKVFYLMVKVDIVDVMLVCEICYIN